MFTYKFPFFLKSFAIAKHLVDLVIVPLTVRAKSLNSPVVLDVVHVGFDLDLGHVDLLVTEGLRLVVSGDSLCGADVAVGYRLLLVRASSLVGLVIVVVASGWSPVDARVADPPSEHVVDLLLVENHLRVDSVAQDLVVQQVHVVHAGLGVAQLTEDLVSGIKIIAALDVVIDVRVADRVIEDSHDDGHLADRLVEIVVVLGPQLPETPSGESDLV